jgi:gas vesicle protein
VKKTMLNEFKSFNVERANDEELVALAAFGRVLRAEYESSNIEVPTWVTDNLRTLRREIASRNADNLEKTLREKKARLEALKPAEQRREELQKEIDALQEKVNALNPTASTPA